MEVNNIKASNILPLQDYIDKNFNGNVSVFARYVGRSPSTVYSMLQSPKPHYAMTIDSQLEIVMIK